MPGPRYALTRELNYKTIYYGWVVDFVESVVPVPPVNPCWPLVAFETAPAFKLFEGLAVSFWQEIKVAAANAITQKEIIVFFIKNVFCCKKIV